MPPVGKLGKLPPKLNPKTLLFRNYQGTDPLPIPSVKKAWEYAIADDAWGMFGNDAVGNCTCASKAHILMTVTANAGKIIIPTLADVMSMYSAVTGYDPTKTQPDGSNPTDNGAAMTDILNYMLTNGFAGRKILGWVQIDQTNRTHFEQCVELFGASDTGVQLPVSAVTQFNAGQNWDLVSPDGGIDGGHDVPYLGFGRAGETCITWAHRQPGNIGWFTTYCDEAYGIIWDDWFDTNDVAPNHFKKDTLWADLKALAV
jgi:hypothetical protein